VSDQETILRAIESNPTDDSAWLAYADWLEEQGNPLSSVLRETLRAGTWGRCREDLFQELERDTRRLLACDCAERLLPYYESRYPTDSRPRRLIETLRRYATGKRIAAAKAAVAEACTVAAKDARSDPDRFLVALHAAQMAYRVTEMPSNACLNAAYTLAVGRFGPDVVLSVIGPNDIAFKPEWRSAVDAEFRWQVARLLRYRFGYA
jgi:uncharacterized protein (TIGR02996 family)